MPSSSQTFSVTGTFTWPAGVQWVTVEVWGGGAAGGAGTGNPAGGGGGSGGSYARRRFTRPSGGTDTVTVGTAVLGNSSSAGSNGNNSWFRSNDADGCIAQGGVGGGLASVNGTSVAGGTASTAQNTGDFNFAGGNGGTGSAGASAGGGGEAGNPYSTGAAGGVTTAGSGNGSGGDGGAGGSTAGTGGNGTDGTAPGGGGGGGRAGSATNRRGGDGAAGQIIVSWDPQQLNNYNSGFKSDGLSVGERIR